MASMGIIAIGFLGSREPVLCHQLRNTRCWVRVILALTMTRDFIIALVIGEMTFLKSGQIMRGSPNLQMTR
jgi:hypothetical protein